MERRNGRNEYEFSETNPIANKLQQYRKDGKLTDITFIIGNKQFPAHRVVLNDISPVIDAMISEVWSNVKNDNTCKIGDEYIDPDIFEPLLDYFYTRKLIFTLDNAHSICVASHFLQIEVLRLESERFLSEHITQDNVLKFYDLSNRYQLEILRKPCIKFIGLNCKNILNEENKVEILRFSEENLNTLFNELKRDIKISIARENIFHILMFWIEYGSRGFGDRIHEIFIYFLQSIPLHELSLDFLMQNAVQNSIINSSKLGLKLANTAASRIYTNTPFTNLQNVKGQYLYCLGGINGEDNHGLTSNSRWCYETGEWRILAEMSQSRYLFGTAVIGNCIYVCGGFSNDGRTNRMEMFDCHKNTWKILPESSMRKAKSEFAMVAFNPNIYIAGGKDPKGAVTPEFECYNIQNKRWTVMPSMKEARQYFELISLNGFLYAIGGMKVNTAECFDIARNTWKYIEKMNYSHSYLSATVHDGKIYVSSSEGFEFYTPEDNTWKRLPLLRDVSGYNLISIDRRLLTTGGGCSSTLFGANKHMFEFDSDFDQWIPFRDMNIPRRFHRSIVIDHR